MKGAGERMTREGAIRDGTSEETHLTAVYPALFFIFPFLNVMSRVFVDICIMAVLAESSRKRCYNCTLGRMTMKLRHRALGRLLIFSHCSLITLLRTARALHHAHSFTHSLILFRTDEKDYFLWIECVNFMSFQPTALYFSPGRTHTHKGEVETNEKVTPWFKWQATACNKKRHLKVKHTLTQRSRCKKRNLKKQTKKSQKKKRHKYRMTHTYNTHSHTCTRNCAAKTNEIAEP